MSNEIEVFEAKILSDPGEGFQSRDVIYTIAQRLISHTRGKVVGGYVKDEKAGKMVPVQNPYTPGDLILSDALYAVEFALTRGLSPYGHLHLWYQRTRNSPIPLLIVDIDYKILKGWAEMQEPFRTQVFSMTQEEREEYGLKPGDLGAVAYNILDSEANYLHQYKFQFLAQGMPFDKVQRLAAQAVAKSSGIGVVLAGEMQTSTNKNVPAPKGRTWQWRAGTRAMRDAIRRSHGDPPPAKIKQFAEQGHFAISEKHLHLLADKNYPTDLPEEDQQVYLQIADHTQEAIANTPHDLKLANGLMRDNGDDDPLDVSPEETETPPSPEIPPELAELTAALEAEIETNPRKGPATEKQLTIIDEKLTECFTGEDDAEDKGRAVLGWLFGEKINFAQAQALGHVLLLDQEETGDYPLNRGFIPLAHLIYKQGLIESGQLQLL